MQAVRIANYKIISGTFLDLAERATSGLSGAFKAQPGFLRYGLADTGDGTCLSISLWESHDEAEAATPLAAAWAREHLADRIKLCSNGAGDLAFSEGVPVTA